MSKLMRTNLCSVNKKDDVQTPTYLYDTLNSIYKFDFDPCPFLSSEKDGLAKEWGSMNWVNPPYSNIKPWVTKAIQQLSQGKKTVMLIPVRTASRYWQDLVFPFADDILFLDKTIVFDGYRNSCPFPLALVEFLTPGIKRTVTQINTEHIVRKRTKAVVKFYRYKHDERSTYVGRSSRSQIPRKDGSRTRRKEKAVDQGVPRADGIDEGAPQTV